VLGEEEVVVLDVKPVDLHGVIYRDVTVTFPDRSIGQARLGPKVSPRISSRVMSYWRRRSST